MQSRTRHLLIRSANSYVRQEVRPRSFSQTTKALSPIESPGRKTVLIIGGRSQLGEALRARFLAAEWDVVCTTQGKANHKFDDKGFHLHGGVDIGKKEAQTKEYWNKLFSEVSGKYGPIHTVVNCAGISINDPNAGYSMDDVNAKPVKPMLEAAIDREIPRFTQISTQAVKYKKVRKSGTYAGSKWLAEKNIKETTRIGTKGTKVTIVRPDLIISSNNPGHFGGPQRMSGPPFKFTAGKDPKNAGKTILQLVSAYDVSDAIVNISEGNLNTPQPIDMCGPEMHTIGGLQNLFKERRRERYIVGLKLPTSALRHATKIHPKGAFEPDHLDLIEHHEKDKIGKVNNDKFARIVALSRPENKDSPLLTIKETMEFSKRPAYGNHDIGHYTAELLHKTKMKDVLPLISGAADGVWRSRIDFDPHDKFRNRYKKEGKEPPFDP